MSAKFDFSLCRLIDLEGNQTPDVHKPLANAIWKFAKDLDLVEKARLINEGKAVELEKTEVADILRIIDLEQAGFFAFAKKAYKDYIQKVQDDYNKKKDNEKA